MASYAKCTISSQNLAVRATASASGTLLFSIDKNEVVEVTSTATSGWYKIKHPKGTGYCSSSYMSSVTTSNGTDAKITVTSGVVNIRTGPSTAFAQYYTLANNTAIKVLETFNSWKIISTSSGVGCVHPDYVSAGSGSGGSGGSGDTSSNYQCLPIPGGAYAYSQMNVNADFFRVDTWVKVTDQGYTDWFYYPGQVEARYILRKNMDVSYDNSKHPDTVFGSAVLKSGSSGRYVIHLQHYLNRYLSSVGYAKMAIDGSFGATTKQKVGAFQQSQGLSNDGEVGSNTKNALIAFVRGLG